MANKSYSEKLKDPRWQKKRLQILDRDDWTCVKCGDEETTLNVHHLEYNGNPWDAKNEKLVTLCEDCHEEIECLKSYKIEFSKINILKKWTNGGVKVLLIRAPGIFRMMIKDNEKQYFQGFNFVENTTEEIVNLITDSDGNI